MKQHTALRCPQDHAGINESQEPRQEVQCRLRQGSLPSENASQQYPGTTDLAAAAWQRVQL